MNDIIKNQDNSLSSIEDYEVVPAEGDTLVLAEAAQNIVNNVTNAINNVAATMSEISRISAHVEMETKRLDHALDCLMVKAQRDITIYRDTLPLLEKNFTDMQARMDRLMDRTMDMICEDVSESSLARQEMAMRMIEMTNNSINNLVAKLLPNHA
ncbi:MAG: hypothetical protein K2M83_11480 [Muribaculaceae bacterium]|nr:hypothetical protein [Bacteroides sp.]MDE6194588.1 hypothetical protein [Muribaculaceae bacterium]MDE6856010.1 hypothetical protein [Muribaculaceae bacterium]